MKCHFFSLELVRSATKFEIYIKIQHILLKFYLQSAPTEALKLVRDFFLFYMNTQNIYLKTYHQRQIDKDLLPHGNLDPL